MHRLYTNLVRDIVLKKKKKKVCQVGRLSQTLKSVSVITTSLLLCFGSMGGAREAQCQAHQFLSHRKRLAPESKRIIEDPREGRPS